MTDVRLRAASAFFLLTLSAVPVAGQDRGLQDFGAGRGADLSAEEGLAVDIELVLAVDVSWSMDAGEQEIQRTGYAAALRSADVQKAIMDGVHGRVAITYVEWAGSVSQSVAVPWTVIDSRASADAFAYRLTAGSAQRMQRTSISGAIDFAAGLFDDNGYTGMRRVIDISGDGPNNQGRLVTAARDAANAAGIVVNGLPLMTADRHASWASIPDLDRYYADCVVGGPGSFVIPVTDWGQFPDAVRRKLVLELAGWPDREGEDDHVRQAADGQSDCTVGERLWQERQMRWLDELP